MSDDVSTPQQYRPVQDAIEVHRRALLDIAQKHGGPIAISVFLGKPGADVPLHRSTWRALNGEHDHVLPNADGRARQTFNGEGIGVGIAGGISAGEASRYEALLIAGIAEKLGIAAH